MSEVSFSVSANELLAYADAIEKPEGDSKLARVDDAKIESAGGTVHVVKEGESMWRIAERLASSTGADVSAVYAQILTANSRQFNTAAAPAGNSRDSDRSTARWNPNHLKMNDEIIIPKALAKAEKELTQKEGARPSGTTAETQAQRTTQEQGGQAAVQGQVSTQTAQMASQAQRQDREQQTKTLTQSVAQPGAACQSGPAREIEMLSGKANTGRVFELKQLIDDYNRIGADGYTIEQFRAQYGGRITVIGEVEKVTPDLISLRERDFLQGSKCAAPPDQNRRIVKAGLYNKDPSGAQALSVDTKAGTLVQMNVNLPTHKKPGIGRELLLENPEVVGVGSAGAPRPVTKANTGTPGQVPAALSPPTRTP